MEKSCKDCGVVFPYAEFKSGKQVRPYCRSCRSLRKKARLAVMRQTTPRKHRISTEIRDGDNFICVTCGGSKPLVEKVKTLSWKCKSCAAEYDEARRRSQGIAKRLTSVVEDGRKTCVSCGIQGEIESFSPNARGRGGVSAYCRSCVNASARVRNAETGCYREYTRAYRATNRERWRALHRLTQAKRRGLTKITCDGTVTDAVLKAIYATESCAYCRKQTPENQRTADHVIAIASGGHHSADNLVMACRSCNSSKSDLDVTVFLENLNARKSCR